MNVVAPDELAAAVMAATAPGARPLIALDHDGTLSRIAPRPEDAVLVKGAEGVLARLALHAELAIISGRGLDDLRMRFSDADVALISEHGLRCRLPDGDVEQLTPGLAATTLQQLRGQLDDLLAPDDGWIIEDKGVAIAVHHRLVPVDELQPRLASVRSLLDAAAQRSGDPSPSDPQPNGPRGHVQVGKDVLELRPIGANKGSALRWLAGRSSARPVVMVGDDATDEPALLAAEQLGGFGVVVADEDRRSSGSVRLADPDAVVAFLDQLAGRLEQRGA